MQHALAGPRAVSARSRHGTRASMSSRAALSVIFISAFAGCVDGPIDSSLVVTFTDDEWSRVMARAPLTVPVLDETNAVDGDEDAIDYGRALFFSKSLSIDHETSCATCHDPAHGFADPNPFSETIGITTRHTPTVWNAALQRWMFWDGRADSLWSQALGPIENADEMGSDRVTTLRRIASDASLKSAHENLFGALPPLDDTARFPPRAKPHADPADELGQAWTAMDAPDQELVNRAYVGVGKAIGAFEATLRADRSPFDTFVDGLRSDDDEKVAALSPSAQRGLQLFVGRAGCFFCHTGSAFSDFEFHNLAIPDAGYDIGRAVGVSRLLADPFNAKGPFSDDTFGRRAIRLGFLASTIEQDGQLKTPSLRNVALSPPYMHHGGFATLEDVVRFYSTLDPPNPALAGHREDTLIPLELTDDEITDLVSFLESLTDDDAAQRAIDESVRDDGE